MKKIYVKSPHHEGTTKAIKTSLLGTKDYKPTATETREEDIRGLYAFDLNGIAQSVLGVAKVKMSIRVEDLKLENI